MFVVLFEVRPAAGRWDDYLDTARLLRPELEQVDGFVDNVRYRCRGDQGRILSLSIWRDEKAIIRWRTHATHHQQGQRRGRDGIFADYRLRVGEVTADTHPPGGATLGQQRLDETETGAAKAVTITQQLSHHDGPHHDGSDQDGSHQDGSDQDGHPDPAELGDLPAAGLVEQDVYDAILPPVTWLRLAGWTDADHAAAHARGLDGTPVRHRRVRVIRDYGMRERHEAPQYFPDAG